MPDLALKFSYKVEHLQRGSSGLHFSPVSCPSLPYNQWQAAASAHQERLGTVEEGVLLIAAEGTNGIKAMLGTSVFPSYQTNSQPEFFRLDIL